MIHTTVATTRDMIFNFLVQFKRKHNGNSPTTREIADACNLSSLTTVRHHLMVLAREGRIILSDDRRYNVEIVGAKWSFPETQDGSDDAAPPDATHQPEDAASGAYGAAESEHGASDSQG